jgi:hypothetical protein
VLGETHILRLNSLFPHSAMCALLAEETSNRHSCAGPQSSFFAMSFLSFAVVSTIISVTPAVSV